MDDDDFARLSAEQQDSLDDNLRIVAIGCAVLFEAESNPKFHKWLAMVLDARLDRQDDRDLFDFLPERPSSNVVPFPALPPKIT